MSVSSVLSATSTNSVAPQQTKKNGALTKADFLNLLITQMKYQDPLAPMDSYQMASQMAQLSTVDAMNQMSQSMKNLENYQAQASSLQSVGLIGKKVEVKGNFLSIDGGKASEGAYQLSKPGKVTLYIYDANGNLVRKIEDGLKDTSKQKILWDGKNQTGETLSDGSFSFRVEAVDEKGQSIQMSSSTTGTVSGISFENGVSYLQIGAGKVPTSDILAILS
jgi:flagellar basal-body rod modification protein FlgD